MPSMQERRRISHERASSSRLSMSAAAMSGRKGFSSRLPYAAA
jgi:hypothetical protein